LIAELETLVESITYPGLALKSYRTRNADFMISLEQSPREREFRMILIRNGYYAQDNCPTRELVNYP